MTKEQQEYLARDLEDAMTSGDAKRIDRAHSNILLALIDCQRKTADRVKELMIDADRRKNRLEGASWLWKVLQLFAASGGGAIILKLLSATN